MLRTKPPPNEKACPNVLPFAECGTNNRLFALVHKVFAPFVGVRAFLCSGLNTSKEGKATARGCITGDVANRGNARLFLWPRNDETRKTGKSCGLLNSSPGGEKGTVNGLY